MALKIFQASALVSIVSAIEPIPPMKGPSVGDQSGSAFDDWSDKGFNGGIAAMCIVVGDTATLAPFIKSIGASYAGNMAGHGTSTLPTQSCFSLLHDEHFVEVVVAIGYSGEFMKHDGVTGVQFVTSSNRTTPWWGNKGKTQKKWVAPSGKHLVGLYGREHAIPLAGWVSNLGVYWGNGGGTGQWMPIQSCPGCGQFEYKYSVCTKNADQTSKAISDKWKISVPGEMEGSFRAIFGLVKGQFLVHLISGYFSKAVTTESTSSFESTVCKEISFTCPSSRLFQWTFVSNFDLKGDTYTQTQYMVCTDHPRPCCLPGTFTKDPTVCDVNPDAPNGCNATIVV